MGCHQSRKSHEEDGDYGGGRDVGFQLVSGVMNRDQPSEEGGHDGGTQLVARVTYSDQLGEEGGRDGGGGDGGTQMFPGLMNSDQFAKESSLISGPCEGFWYCKTCLAASNKEFDESPLCRCCGESRKLVFSGFRALVCDICEENFRLALFDDIGGWDEERGVLFGAVALKCLSAVDNFSRDQESLQKLGSCQELRLSFLNLKSKDLLVGLTLCRSLVNLDLSRNELTSIPDVIFLLTLLESLNLSINMLAEIPSDIKALAQLKDVNLSHNEIGDITALCQCIKLRRLVIHDNQLVNIPVEIVNLIELEEIDLSRNQISECGSLLACAKLKKVLLFLNHLVSTPAEVGKSSEMEEINLSWNQISEFDSLVACAKLKKVSLHENNLAAIPAEVGKLSEMEEIDLSENQISEFDSLVTCAKLKKVSLHRNKLTVIPAEVGKLSEMEEIDLSENQISEFDSLVACAKLKKVSLHENNLAAIPAEVGKLSEMEEIDLSENQISEFDSLVTCAKLKKVSLRQNKLAAIPAEVGKLREIEEIYLSNNQIGEFISLANCSKLKKVSLRDNKLLSIPSEVGKLSEMEEIDLSNNKVSEIGSLMSCARLRAVFLSNNRIKDIPHSIGNLKQLEQLGLSNNHIKDIPPSVGKLKQLERLDLSNRRIDDFPLGIPFLKQLQRQSNVYGEFTLNDICNLPDEVCQLKNLNSLVLTYNSLRQLPMHIDQCDSLKKLELDGNPLTRPPVEVCQSGLEAIFQYFKDLRQSESRVRKQQVVFLGETGAGKTSLARTLLNNQPSLADPEDRTRVLDRYVLKTSNDLQIQITDFGGHHVYELAHTFFLTSEVIASLVVDLSLYDDDNYMNFAGRWLSTLMTMSWKSTVLVVGTHSDCCVVEEIERKKEGLLGRIKDQHQQMITDVKRQQERITKTIKWYGGRPEFHGYVRYLEDIRKSRERHLESLLSNFNLIDDIFVMSSHSMHGIPEFKSRLIEVCDKKAATLPGSWLAIQDIMDEQSDEPCIMLEKFHEIVHRGFTVRELPTDDIQHTASVLLSYQHQCGNYLWFEDDDQLKSYVFHRPDFVVEFLKDIFHHEMKAHLELGNKNCDFSEFTEVSFENEKEDFLKCGHISTKLLKCLLKQHVKDDRLFDVLIHLLEKFSLCFLVRKTEYSSIYCFPWFLKNVQPDNVLAKWQNGHEYQVEFHFPRKCPKAFFELVVVKIYQCFGPTLILQDVDTWQNGIYLQKDFVKLKLTKEHEIRDVIVRLAVKGDKVDSLWSPLMTSYNTLVGLLISKWPGVSYDVFYVCPHCLNDVSSDRKPSRYPMQDLKKFYSSVKFLSCKKSKERVPMDVIVPGSFHSPSIGQLFEAGKNITDVHHEKIPEGVASTSTDPSTDTAISHEKELHYKLLKVVADHLLDTDFAKLKHYCGLWIMPAHQEHIKDTWELLEQLEKQGVIELGNYLNLIELLKEHNLINIKKKVEALAEKIDKLKTNP